MDTHIVYRILPELTPRRLAINAASQFWPQTTKAGNKGSRSTEDAQVAGLKQELLDVVRATERGVSTTPEQREEIDRLIVALEPCKRESPASWAGQEGLCPTVITWVLL